MITLTGGGYGHGIGMAQWGAEGQAREGASAEEILARYYPGTTVGELPAARVRVLLELGATIRLALPAGARLRIDELPAVAAPRGLRAALSADGARIVVRDGAGRLRGSGGKVRVRPPADGPLLHAGTRYRGDLVLRRRGGELALVEDVALDDYVRGVIAREVPASWRPATLAAQAIAARSYALASARPGDVFDVYTDTRSQVYGGVDAETPTTDAAVAETAGAVVQLDGAVVKTFFYDTSPGRTASIEDVWGGDPLPYLTSVADPWSRLSPYYRWAPARWAPVALGRALGGGRVDGIELERGTGGWVRSLRVRTGRGGWRSLRGTEVRSALGLRSTWFALQLVDLRRVERVPGGVRVLAHISPGGTVRVHLRSATTGRWTTRRLGTRPDGRLDRVVRAGALEVDAVRLQVDAGRSEIVRAR